MSAYTEIRRDGFISIFGRFLTDDRIDRIEGSQLRSMFLPKLSREGQKALRDNRNFVRSQLKHYGVQIDGKKFFGNGTALLKAALQAGKCDQVPDHILELQWQMHEEWISELTPEQLSSNPEWVVQRYFLSAGKPDHTKTTTVVGIPLDRYSQYRSGKVMDVADKITGLHHRKALGPKTQVIFMGWNQAAVEKAAKQHPTEEARRVKNKEDERKRKREKLHTEHLNSRSQQTEDMTPVGSYIVDCEFIETEWPSMADDLRLDIHKTKTPSVFKADFDFGVFEGVMIVCADEAALDAYCTEAEGDFSDEEDEEDDVPTKEDVKLGTKRKLPAPKRVGRPKKSKAEQGQPRKYLLKLKGRETGEGMICYEATSGTINFKDQAFARFKGEADISGIGSGVSFLARKISTLPGPSRNDWADYSERQYEKERINRWR
ncbi:hypothetical protein ASPZODRAFT_137291 [Penicilliopsis zonata CBS 506.65]|uniref:Uncharacterized protein n=1 Tax=Penicilliopsis zonata CBS 506.65 TaxID=1073090 RepID=A0A1L9S5T8_9EURO|nr:hypothetical protein ASPZODRAFT_137291 [Penicilliopsis zonata CBS 506.65]OJJ42500.1 hypothetical protein ASPZODRAFT_137291 [Penicilliopsis zonata CBS 506.65]